MINDQYFAKNFIWNIVGTTLNAFNSLFFLICVTRVNGLEDAGIFSIAFSTACILYMLGIYSGRVFQVTDATNTNDREFIINRFITSFIMILLIVFFVILKGYSLYKASIFILICFYKMLEALSDVFYGIFQKNNLLYKVGISYTLKALIGIVCFVVINVLTHNLILSIISIIVISLLITLLYDIINSRKLYNYTDNIKISNILNLFKTGFFTFAISFLGVYLLNAPKYAIDVFLSEDIQAIFGIIIMPATVIGLCAQFLIHPYLITILNFYKTKEFKKLKKLLYKIILYLLGIGVLCSLLGYYLGTPILGFIYNVDLSQYSTHLLFILIAATLYTISTILSSILITMRHTGVQFIIYIINSIIALLLCNFFVYKFSLNGAIIAFFITMLLCFILFYIIFIKIVNKEQLLFERSVNEDGK
ncbi:MAG: hypothetical protein Q4G09_04375 [Clostridia bacterium]|nr:hypothetical protein [Clostridia bacterium]